MPTKMSEFFTLDEMLVSEFAARKGIDNSPSLEVLATLKLTAMEMDKVRAFLGKPVLPSSWYRCLELNRALGSKGNSQHVKGEAVDFISPEFGTVQQVFDAIRKSDIRFDQLIVECGRWVHISFSTRNRRQCLAFDGNHYTPVA